MFFRLPSLSHEKKVKDTTEEENWIFDLCWDGKGKISANNSAINKLMKWNRINQFVDTLNIDKELSTLRGWITDCQIVSHCVYRNLSYIRRTTCTRHWHDVLKFLTLIFQYKKSNCIEGNFELNHVQDE